MTIYLGVTKNKLCPVTALLQYLIIRPARKGLLFISREGKFLTKPWLVQKVREALTTAGIDSTHYSGHWFRIGTATLAATCGVSDNLIKTRGRWSSSAFQSYIKIPLIDLAQASSVLAPQRMVSHINTFSIFSHAIRTSQTAPKPRTFPAHSSFIIAYLYRLSIG